MSANTIESLEKANFETAISATKFGKFNYLLLLCSIPAAMTPIIDNTVMSYVIPMAQCDLNLSLEQKGMLNSAVFIGSILSGYCWGFLADSLGRKKLLFVAYTLDVIFNILVATMQYFWLQYVFKLLAGFVSSGPYSLIITYVSEFHSSLYRSKAVMLIGVSMVTSLIFSAVLAWLIMPLSDIFIFTYVLHPWQLYMLIAAVPNLISSIVFAFLPESPKFLMTAGKNEDALKIFRMIYAWNTGNKEDTYTIKELNNETCNLNSNANYDSNKSLSIPNILKILQAGLIQLKPLFQQPYLLNISLVCAIHFGVLSGANTLRLWLPQIFTSIDEFNQIHGSNNASLCDVIEHSFGNMGAGNSTEIEAPECKVILPQDRVYINSLVVALACLLGNLIIVAIINRFSKKSILVSMVTMGGCTAFGVYWTPNQNIMLAVSAFYLTMVVTSSTTLMSVVVELFPTSLRGVAVSLTVMTGQLGAFLGNLLFPLLLAAGCLPPFLFLGCLVTFCGLLSFSLPNPSAKDFK